MLNGPQIENTADLIGVSLELKSWSLRERYRCNKIAHLSKPFCSILSDEEGNNLRNFGTPNPFSSKLGH